MKKNILNGSLFNDTDFDETPKGVTVSASEKKQNIISIMSLLGGIIVKKTNDIVIEGMTTNKEIFSLNTTINANKDFSESWSGNSPGEIQEAKEDIEKYTLEKEQKEKYVEGLRDQYTQANEVYKGIIDFIADKQK